MPQSHSTRTKNSKKTAAPRIAPIEETAEVAEDSFLAKKAKKMPDPVEEEALLPTPEKLDEVSPFGEVPVEEDGDEEAGLDDEELNPFGDKWEV